MRRIVIWGVSVLLAGAAVGIAVLRLPDDRPRALVAGRADPPPPRLSPDEAGIEIGALEEAAEYAARARSQALLVMRNGHLVYERYWDGTGFDTGIDADSFAQPLAALLVGSALADRAIPYPDASVRSADAQALGALLERGTGKRYAEYLSEKLWKPLGAADAQVSSDARRVHAWQGDWIRLGEALLAEGVYQGVEVMPPAWARETLRSNIARSGSEAYAAREVFVLGGDDGHRLWIVPSLRLAILRVAARGGRRAGWEEARIPNLVIRGLRDLAPGPAKGPKIDPADYAPGH
jgi:hypothetical protein